MVLFSPAHREYPLPDQDSSARMGHGSKILFFDLLSPYTINIARNANPGLNIQFPLFRGPLRTGLNAPLPIQFFRITDKSAPNPEQGI